MSIIKGGIPIAEDCVYEKNRRTLGTIRMCAFMHIKN